METSSHADSQIAQQTYSPLRVIAAWAVHFYTATGMIAAAFATLFILQGDEASIRWFFLMLTLALVIDSSDGVLARKADVKHVTPNFSGRRLDDIIDFHTYTSLPLLLLWKIQVFSPSYQWLLLIPLLASLYGFCQESIKTDDGYFLGFPSYWNVFAYYAYVLDWSATTVAILMLLFSFLTFVPSRYMYPSQRGLLNRVTALLAILWCFLSLYIFWRWFSEPIHSPALMFLHKLSMLFPLYYMVASWWVSIQMWRAESRVQ
jgi:phosphatidylcholine synthase